MRRPLASHQPLTQGKALLGKRSSRYGSVTLAIYPDSNIATKLVGGDAAPVRRSSYSVPLPNKEEF